MAKEGSLSSKVRSVLKKMNSFSKQNSSKKLSRDISNASSSSSTSNPDQIEQRTQQKVYVGRSRREYQIPTELLDHPVIRELVIDNDDDDCEVIGCEVVLFDHLCWMLEEQNSAAQIDHQMAAFYAY